MTNLTAQPVLDPANQVPTAPATSAPPAPPPPTTAELIDYDDAFVRLGDRLPDGSTIVVGMVEGDSPTPGQAGSYTPDVQHPDFRGLDIVRRSGPSNVSGHAQRVASILTGRRGIAPKLKRLDCFAVNHWMTQGYLNLAAPREPLHGADSPRVFSHSWIASDAARAVPVLRRVDWAIDKHDVVMCVGINNGKDSLMPPTLAGSYNAIAVGVDNGNSSGGGTTVEGAGRAKPDLVAPGNMTSFSTPAVAACAAILLQWADGMVVDGHRDANRAETIKAVLLAGATKHRTWTPAPGRPLDDHLGAGRVNLDHSLRILDGGQTTPGSRITRGKAWAYATLPPRQTHRYILQVPERIGGLGEVSIALTWHRRIDGQTIAFKSSTNPDGPQRSLWYSAPRLADLDLRLVRIDADGQTVSTVAESTSRIDNVEHLYLKELPVGRYALEVTRDPDHEQLGDEAWDYALAWRLEPGDSD